MRGDLAFRSDILPALNRRHPALAAFAASACLWSSFFPPKMECLGRLLCIPSEVLGIPPHFPPFMQRGGNSRTQPSIRVLELLGPGTQSRFQRRSEPPVRHMVPLARTAATGTYLY